MRKLSIILLLLIFSCETGPKDSRQDSIPAITEKNFPNFPESQFENIHLGMMSNEAIENLNKTGYELKKNFPFHYVHQQKQIELIIPDQEKVNQFKAFLMHPDDVSKADELAAFFEDNADDSALSKSFSVFDFQHKKTEFTITFLVLKDMIRLNFELKTPH